MTHEAPSVRDHVGSPRPGPAPVSRRSILHGGVLLAGAAGLRVASGGPDLLQAVLASGSAASTTVVERLRRGTDLLVGNLVLRDLTTISRSGATYLTPRPGVATGYLALVLPGQSLGEQGFDVTGALPPGGTGSVPAPLSELAPPTVLAFSVPTDVELLYDVTGLLDWHSLSVAKATGVVTRPPTRVEAPFRLVMSPLPDTHRWSRTGAPVRLVLNSAQTTELWHVRSQGRNTEGGPDDRLHGTASFLNAGSTTLGALSDLERSQIAAQSATTQEVNGEASRRPVLLNHLALTSLGATLDLTGRWPRAQQLLAWDHRATIGRDQYVKTVTRGFLAPWGHDAVLISETWRRMRQDGSNPPESLLVKTSTLLVTPEVDTSVEFARTGTDKPGLRLPFTSVRCTVRTTPPVSNAEDLKTSGGFPIVAGQALVLPFVGTDWTGRETPLSCPVYFVPGAKSGVSAASAYTGQPSVLRTADLGGRPVAVASPDPSVPGGTTLPVTGMRLRITAILGGTLAGRRRAPFRPEAEQVDTEVPQVSALAGGGTIAHAYHKSYVQDPANPGGIVLARLASSAPAEVGGERTAGLVQVPTYQGLSRTSGAVLASSPEALTSCAAGSPPSATEVFGQITLLGGIALSDIVDLSLPAPAATALGVPAGVPAGVPVARSVSDDGRQTVTLTITPALHDKLVGPIRFVADDGDDQGSLVIVATAAAGGSAPAEISVDARLQHVALQLADLVVLPIHEFRVCIRTGAPLDVDFRPGDVSFLGPLAFLQTLCDVLALLAGPSAAAAASDPAIALGPVGGGAGLAPPSVDVDETGLSLRQGVALPDLPLGAFTLTGLAFGLGFRLPFSGALVVDLEFASKESPFQATYLCFGGGGYAAVQLTGGDVSLVEVGIHVAGALGLNLGVASGSVSVSVGLCMALPAGGGVELTAYFRACGRLSVLELVSMSTTFELSLTFVEPATGPTMLSGKASLEFKVELLFFSKTVSTSVTRTLAGGEKGHPVGSAPLAAKAAGSAAGAAALGPDATGFTDAYPDQGAWARYCTAYAPVGAA